MRLFFIIAAAILVALFLWFVFPGPQLRAEDAEDGETGMAPAAVVYRLAA